MRLGEVLWLLAGLLVAAVIMLSMSLPPITVRGVANGDLEVSSMPREAVIITWARDSLAPRVVRIQPGLLPRSIVVPVEAGSFYSLVLSGPFYPVVFSLILAAAGLSLSFRGRSLAVSVLVVVAAVSALLFLVLYYTGVSEKIETGLYSVSGIREISPPEWATWMAVYSEGVVGISVGGSEWSLSNSTILVPLKPGSRVTLAASSILGGSRVAVVYYGDPDLPSFNGLLLVSLFAGATALLLSVHNLYMERMMRQSPFRRSEETSS